MSVKGTIIANFEKKQQEQIAAIENRKIENFLPGDTVKVDIRIVEGNNFRVQSFIGVCLGRKNAGLRSSFKVRKVSDGAGIQKHFSLFSPSIAGVTVVRSGKVRRAKLYYLQKLHGKAARIKERIFTANKES